MASITAAIGPHTSTLNASDAAAAGLVRAYCRAEGAPEGLTDAQTLTWFLRHLMSYAKRVGDDLEVAELARDAAAAERLAREANVFEETG